ncbi:hypothetical protein FXO38_01598 [Capsicum annuum]|nr:hypothetical protein FXO37_10857 [Capsicum annuum]KAF3681721.1 hypothetical protein FXO38_01598 [Capsicum annuum]
MVSAGGTFALGFFITRNSTAVFTIGDDRNLVIFDEKDQLIWSSNVSSATKELLASNYTVGALLDNINLVNNMTKHIQNETSDNPMLIHESVLGKRREMKAKRDINNARRFLGWGNGLPRGWLKVVAGFRLLKRGGEEEGEERKGERITVLIRKM